MYVPLPPDLCQYVVPHLYFPYFGSLTKATDATMAINCGPKEADWDSLGTWGTGWCAGLGAQATADSFCHPSLVERPSYYFRYGCSDAHGLGHPAPDRFWRFFDGVGPPKTNPLHSSHYRLGNLVHLDAVPWCTRQPWGNVPNPVRTRMLELGMPVLLKVILAAGNLQRIFVRGKGAANALATTLGFALNWVHVHPLHDPGLVLEIGDGVAHLPDRQIAVRAVNQFDRIPPVIKALLAHGD